MLHRGSGITPEIPTYAAAAVFVGRRYGLSQACWEFELSTEAWQALGDAVRPRERFLSILEAMSMDSMG